MPYFISAKELKKKIEEKEEFALLDVRRLDEYEKVHVSGARHIDMENLDQEQILDLKEINRATPIYLICRSGVRSKSALDKFLAVGISDARSVEGGTIECEKIGVSVIKTIKKTSWIAKIKDSLQKAVLR